MSTRTLTDLLESRGNRLHDLVEYRNRTRVSRGRGHAGDVLAGMLRQWAEGTTLVLAVLVGGVPVAVTLALKLELQLDVAVASKITLPGNTEVGCGAVAFDGTVALNDALLRHLHLGGSDLARRIAAIRAKVARRPEALRAGQPPLAEGGAPVLLVDDGLASG